MKQDTMMQQDAVEHSAMRPNAMRPNAMRPGATVLAILIRHAKTVLYCALFIAIAPPDAWGFEEVDFAALADRPARATDATQEEWHAGGPKLSGFIRPAAVIRYRPNALPRDTWNYGVGDSLVVFDMYKAPSRVFGYRLLIFGSTKKVSVLTNAHLTDGIEGSEERGLSKSVTSVVGSLIDEAAIYVQPVEGLRLRIGQMRVPYTLELWSVLAQQLFWERASPTSYFLPTTDFGILAEWLPTDDVVRIRAGVFNGSGVSAGAGKDRGAMYGFRADLSPFGTARLIDHERKGFRGSVGMGLFYYPSKVFDSAGYVTSHAQDLRMDISARVNLFGFSAQGEYLRRESADSVSGLRETDTGWYVQGAQFIPVSRGWGISPVVRYGTVTTGVRFMPRTTRWLQAGFSVFAGGVDGAPYNSTHLQAIYIRERRVTEGDRAHLLLTRYLVQF